MSIWLSGANNKRILGEFKEFIMRGKVLDMAVGIIIGIEIELNH
jgi:hypothetical protein